MKLIQDFHILKNRLVFEGLAISVRASMKCYRILSSDNSHLMGSRPVLKGKKKRAG